jgi:3-isopropylmalate dehydrogenase
MLRNLVATALGLKWSESRRKSWRSPRSASDSRLTGRVTIGEANAIFAPAKSFLQARLIRSGSTTPFFSAPSVTQYINLRPVKLYPGVWTPLKDKGPEHIDFVVVRENNEGLYTGAGGFLKYGTPEEVATQVSIQSRSGCDRCLKFAFELTRRRNRRKTLTLVGKTNVLTYEFDLWERAFHAMGSQYPDVKRDYNHVDACCMWFVKNPEWYDVVVTNNLFGDIITDLGAMIQGGMGIASGGNINPEGVSMYEPIGGSAPKYTGQNIINPMAAIGAGAMLLEHSLKEVEAAAAIERAIMKTTAEKMSSQSAGKMGMGTTQVGDTVAQLVADGI